MEQTIQDSKFKELEEKIAKLEKDYNYLFNFLKENLERVYTLSTKDKFNYREIYRLGEKITKEEINRGWKEEPWTIGYTFKNKLE